MAKVITITSGQDGVGKTSIGVNLALRLSQRGKRVCLFDATIGLETIKSLLGVKPDGTLKEILGSRRSLADILVQNYHGIDVLPDSPAMEQLRGFESASPKPPARPFDSLHNYDYFLIDTSAGLSRTTLAFCLASAEVILVITPESDSLTSTDSLIRMLHANSYAGELTAVVNRCETIDDGRHAYSTLHKIAKSHVDVDIPLLGLVFEDAEIERSVEERRAVALSRPESVASRCIRNLATKLVEERAANADDKDMQGFWSRLFWLVDQPLILPRSDRDAETLVAEIPQPRTGIVAAAGSGVGNRTTTPVTPMNQMVATLSEWLAKAHEWQAAHKGGIWHWTSRSRLAGDVSGAETMARLLRDFPYQKQQVGYRKSKMDVYYVERDGQPTLACTFHGAAVATEDHQGNLKSPEASRRQLKR